VQEVASSNLAGPTKFLIDLRTPETPDTQSGVHLESKTSQVRMGHYWAERGFDGTHRQPFRFCVMGSVGIIFERVVTKEKVSISLINIGRRPSSQLLPAQWPRRAPILRVQIAHQGNLFFQVVESFAIHGLLASIRQNTAERVQIPGNDGGGP
jgi:hypothetical protein